MKRDAVLNLRVAARVKEALRCAAAADDGRSLSGMAERVFREWLASHGYLPAEKDRPAPPAGPMGSP